MHMFPVPCLAFSADPVMLIWTRCGLEELSSKVVQAFSITTCHQPRPHLCRIPAKTQKVTPRALNPQGSTARRRQTSTTDEVSLGPSLPSNRATGDGLTEPDQGRVLHTEPPCLFPTHCTSFISLQHTPNAQINYGRLTQNPLFPDTLKSLFLYIYMDIMYTPITFPPRFVKLSYKLLIS